MSRFNYGLFFKLSSAMFTIVYMEFNNIRYINYNSLNYFSKFKLLYNMKKEQI